MVGKGYKKPLDKTSLSQAQKETLKDSRKRYTKALFLIYQALYDDAFEKISDATSTKEAWDKLQIFHKGEDKVKNVHL